MQTEDKFKEDMWTLGQLLKALIDSINYKTDDAFLISEKNGVAMYNLRIHNITQEDLK